jgi:hypothetical protein
MDGLDVQLFAHTVAGQIEGPSGYEAHKIV